VKSGYFRAALLGAVGAALLCGVSQPALAANVPAQVAGAQLAGAEAQRQALFQQMLKHPADVQLALQYAALSSQVGDLEGAISTLERLLIFAPKVARLNFELGVLYQRLGAYDLATTYLQTAASAPDATADIKAQAAMLIAQGGTASTADKNFGLLVFGARYQTNANGGAASDLVSLNGVPFTLNQAAKADPDGNVYAQSYMHFSHDLASQGDKFDTDLSLYGSLYGHHDELNTLAGEIQFGPVINLQHVSINNSTLGLYGLLGGVSLKGDAYLYTAGFGSVLTTALNPSTQVKARAEYRYESYQNSALRPTAANMTGSRVRVAGEIRHQVNQWALLYGSLYGERKDAIVGFDADWEYGGAVGTILSFKGPGPSDVGPWSLDLSVGLAGRNYDAPDPTISADPRRDTEGFAQAVLTVPLPQSWSVISTLGYHKVLSTYDLYTNDNVSASVSLAKSF
jgi:tetratricopeptide (TPR) repeat protein